MTAVWLPLWAVALMLLPGWTVWRLAGPRDMPWPLQLAPSFALSLALIAVVGWSAYALGLGFGAVKAVVVVLMVLAALGAPIALWLRPRMTSERISRPWSFWAALALAVAAALSAAYSGPWLSATADSFYHLAAIRSVLQHGTALPQEVFFSVQVPAADPTSGAWHLALALASSLSGADPVQVWRVMTVAVAPLTVLAFFALGLAITRSGPAALIACVLYFVLALNFDFRDAANPNRFGTLLAWLALASVLRFTESGSRRELVVGAPMAFAASAVHPALSPFILVALACAVAAAILVRSRATTRLIVAAAIVGAAALPLLLIDVLTLSAPAPYAAMAVTSPLPLHAVHRPWTWVWPAFWFDNVGTVLGTAFAVSLVRLWRAGELGAGLVIASVVAIPLAAVTPLFAGTYNAQYLLARVAGVLEPLAWVSWGWGLALAGGALRGRLAVPATALIVISVAATLPAFYVGPLARFVLPAGSTRSFATSRSTDLTVAWRDRLDAIRKLPGSSVLLAEPRMAYELSGLTGKEVVAVPLSHTPAQVEKADGPRRRTDALDAVQGRLDPISLAGVLEHYGVTDVIVDMDRTDAVAWAQLADAAILSPIAGGQRWRLYAYDPGRLNAYLDLTTQAGPAPGIALGIGPQMAVAGRAVFARVEGVVATGTARLVADDLASTLTFSRTIELAGAASSETYALPIPSGAPAGRYRLTLVPGDGQPIALGQFDVGRLYQAEDLGGVVAGDASRWTILGGPAYQGGLAAIGTRPGSAARQTIMPVDAGTYCVAARVYDDGSGRSNEVQLSLGDAAVGLPWSGSAPGMRWLRSEITLRRTGGQLGMRLVQRGQAEAAVDALEVYPLGSGGCTAS